MSSDLANLMNAELKEAFDAFDKVSDTSDISRSVRMWSSSNVSENVGSGAFIF